MSAGVDPFIEKRALQARRMEKALKLLRLVQESGSVFYDANTPFAGALLLLEIALARQTRAGGE